MHHSFRIFFVVVVMTFLLHTPLCREAVAQNPAGGPKVDTAKLNTTVERGLTFLRHKGQTPEGTFTPQAGPGITAIAVTAALKNGRAVDDPMVSKGLTALISFVKPDGGIYGQGRLRNYETCVAIACFQAANKDGRYKELLANADKFVRGLQYGADGSFDKSDVWFGGVGYGGAERPDLSNTSYLIEALQSLDKGANDPAIQRALVFVARCQNLEGQGNDTPFAGKIGDGGFYYTIPKEAIDPSTSDRYTPGGGLRSYGSMTYAGFKSMIYAGLTKDDPRTKSALEWIKKHYSVTDNPGEGDAGLYYYYDTFAAALAASGLDEIVDDKGASHNWRNDLIAELAKRQNPDGSWTNSNRQWFENDPNLSTAFALKALSNCKPKTN